MPQLILAIYHGPHDASAAVLVDYDVKAAVQLERLTRQKGDGRYADLAIDEVLSIAGTTRKDVDVVALPRSDYPVRYFRHFDGWRWLREHVRTYIQGKRTASSRANPLAPTTRGPRARPSPARGESSPA